MYKIKDTKQKELKAVEILHQEEILERTKKKLDPVQAFAIIKKESDGFSKSSVKAQEADELLHRLLNRDTKGASATTSSKKESSKKELSVEEIQIQAKARARALELLELELELELNTKSA